LKVIVKIDVIVRLTVRRGEVVLTISHAHGMSFSGGKDIIVIIDSRYFVRGRMQAGLFPVSTGNGEVGRHPMPIGSGSLPTFFAVTVNSTA